MSVMYKLVVVFNDDRVMSIQDVTQFVHHPNDNVWAIQLSNYDKLAFVGDRDIKFIGPEYVWKHANTDGSEETPKEVIKPNIRDCDFCANSKECTVYRQYLMCNRVKPDGLCCPGFVQL